MVWIVFPSQTQAIQCRNVLAQNGIIGHIGKPPQAGERPHACTWAVGIRWEEQTKSQQACRDRGIRPCAWLDGIGSIL